MKLPEGWKEVKLGDTQYFTILSSGINEFKGEKDYLSTESIQGTKIEKVECRITYANRTGRANMQPVVNSVWFAKMQATFKVYSFDEDNNEEINKYILSTGFAGIKVNEKFILPKYVKLLLKSKDFNETKDKLSTGSTQRGINNQSIEKISFIIPPIPVQKKIITVLEKIETARELRTESDAFTDDFLKSVFLEMFGDPAKNSKKWSKKPLKEFGEIITGNTPPRAVTEYYGDYIEWIKSDNLNTPCTFLTKSAEMLSKKGVEFGRIVPKGAVLVTCIAGSLSCIGNAAIADREVAFNQQINAIVPKKEVNSFFLYYLIVSSKKIIQDSSTQSMKGMVSKGVFGSIQLPMPPLVLQNKFAEIMTEIEKLKEYTEQSKTDIDNLFNILMQKAFKGELTI